MSELPRTRFLPVRWTGPTYWRAAGIAGLIVLVYCLGIYAEEVFAGLTSLWQTILRGLGLDETLSAVQQGVSGQVTTRSLPAMLSYGLLYTACCLALLGLLLGSVRRLKAALLLYAAVFGACTLLVVGGKLGGDVRWAYQLGRRLIDFIVSPLPVIVLAPLLRLLLPEPVPALPHSAAHPAGAETVGRS
ncbi:hypothetical protein LJY25_12365 [Hymenobacter sp. BT175]|uniref:XrtX-associated membrane protein n=1 Tax=Hymenobacter translucens TaxID=2886507 RepID=UPI001D0EC490|nr:hypothetical protein [Hymenobacter translucens]MCC2547243.1 hypothetical protein [Hymenobacter translucens]